MTSDTQSLSENRAASDPDSFNLDGKSILITGGTGSFGNAVLRRFLDSDIAEIRIFSRDEKKQDDMRNAFKNE